MLHIEITYEDTAGVPMIDARAETDSAGCNSRYGGSASSNGCKETLRGAFRPHGSSQ